MELWRGGGFDLFFKNSKFVETERCMSAATKLDKQINDYLIQLNTKQKKAVLTVVRTFAEEQDGDVWEDAEVIAELDRRTAGYESGKAKVRTLDEIETRVRKAYKAKGKSKR